MAQKLPKLFKPVFKDKDFKRQILGRVFIPKARELVLKLYEQQPDSTWKLRDRYCAQPLQLEKDELKKIQILAKEIAKNRGIFDFGKLVLVGLVVGGVVLFVTFFLDDLVRRWTIQGLQAVFGARVDVGRLWVRPWEGKVYFGDLAIADRENPMQNLVEFKDLQVDVDIGALLGGSVLLNRLVAREMRFGTPRERSGALALLPGSVHLASLGSQPPPADPEQPWDPGTLFDVPMQDLPFGNLLNLTRKSPREVFEAEVGKLKAKGLIEEINSTLQERQRFWEERASQAQGRLRGLGNTVSSLVRRDLGQIRDLNELRTLLEQIKKAQEDLQELEGTLREGTEGIRSDLEQLARWRREIPEAIEQDWNYLSGLVAIPSGGPVGWVSALIMPEVNRRYGPQIRLARRVWAIANAVRATQEKKEVPPRPERRGQDIPFPQARYPRFLMSRLEVSIGSRAERDLFEFLLLDVSSEPDLTRKPYTLSFTRLDREKELLIQAQADLQSGSEVPFQASTLIANEPFALGPVFEAVSLKDFQGEATWDARLGFYREGGFRFSVETIIRRPTLEWKEKGEVSDLIDRILTRAGEIQARLSLDIRGEERQITASTNLDEPARREILLWAEEKIRQFTALLRRELENQIERVLRENRALASRLESAVGLINQNWNAYTSYQKQLEDKRTEVETRIAQWATDTLQRNLPQVPTTPTAPSLPNIRPPF